MVKLIITSILKTNYNSLLFSIALIWEMYFFTFEQSYVSTNKDSIHSYAGFILPHLISWFIISIQNIKTRSLHYENLIPIFPDYL